MNLNQVTVQSNNIIESIVFYKTLGLILIVEDTHYARFEFPEGDSTFSIHHMPDSKPSNTIVYFEVSDLLETVSALKQKGVSFIQDPKQESWLWHESRVMDPSGNEICIYNAGTNRKHPPWRVPPT